MKYEEKIEKLSNLINPIMLYDSPTLIGLDYIDSNYFMNAALQCLSQTKDLTNFFLNKKNKEFIMENKTDDINENKLCPAYLNLIEKLWDHTGIKPFKPKEFIGIIEKIYPKFRSGQIKDSKDLIVFILNQIHKELKRPLPNKNKIIPQILNRYDRVNAFNNFYSEFQKESSIISKTFFGFIETSNVCRICNHLYNEKAQKISKSYNYEIFNCLTFPLEEIKKMKNKNNNLQNNYISLYDCFMYNKTTPIAAGNNSNYCSKCKKMYDSLITSQIFSSPKILILVLDRRNFNNCDDVKLDFTEDLDISQFILDKTYLSKLTYSLYSVITHIDKSNPNDYFIASCKNPIDNKWYRYTDSAIYPINDVQNEIIKFETPYILFYENN